MSTDFFLYFRKHLFVTSLILLLFLSAAVVVTAEISSGDWRTGHSLNVTVTNLPIPRPDFVVQGDVLVAGIAFHDGSTVSITPPTGWTQIFRTDKETDVGIVSYWKVAGLSEPADYTWVLSPQTRAEGGITAYRGVDTLNPISAFAGNTGRSKVATTSATSTTASNEEVVALFALRVGSSNFAGDFFSTPIGMAQKYDSSYTAAGPTIASFDAVQVAVGNTGSKYATTSGAINQERDWASQLIVLRRAQQDCVGGTITHVGGNTIHTFSSVGTSTLTCAGVKTANILVVAGGGGGGNNNGGGGGAGGLIIANSRTITSGDHTIVVGGGGVGGILDTRPPSNGNPSSFLDLIAVGGGAAGDGNLAGVHGASGGSGGGACGGCGTPGIGGSGTAGQGNSGGSTPYSGPNYPTGGGGGSGGQGGSPIDGSSDAGNGGSGTQSSISGLAVMYAGGGGGGQGDNGNPGIGGSGGGGNGGATNTSGANGSANTGGGGGGGGGNISQLATGGNGGSGIVIVSYSTQ